jgi:UDP-N-acetyl-D-mannosaminuronic acid dehydrogenase
MSKAMNKYDICVVGGAGHIGAGLSILLASKGQNVLIYDINQKSIDTIRSGKLPFFEENHEPFLKKALSDNKLHFTTNSKDVAFAKNVILTIGTNVDEFKNPRINDIIKCIDSLPINNNHTLILRSTVFPGVTGYVERHLKSNGLTPLLAFCPERLIQGKAFKELQELPQIVSGTSEAAIMQASKLFGLIAPAIVKMEIMEAEFAKLFANTYRYIQFAATNQFYEMATSAGLDYNKILNGVKKDYPRLSDLPSAGFSAGGCLYKDCAQLCAFFEGKFSLGEAAITSNEGLPAFLVNQLERKHNLSDKTVGILGMAFKANIDDNRTSLSYKLKKILKFKSKLVLTSDPLVEDNELLPLNEVIARSDILIVCVPHDEYKNIKSLTNKEVVNIWNG